jgi:hypothetical protein
MRVGVEGLRPALPSQTRAALPHGSALHYSANDFTSGDLGVVTEDVQDVPAELSKLVEWTWDTDPMHRPSFTQVLAALEEAQAVVARRAKNRFGIGSISSTVSSGFSYGRTRGQQGRGSSTASAATTQSGATSTLQSFSSHEHRHMETIASVADLKAPADESAGVASSAPTQSTMQSSRHHSSVSEIGSVSDLYSVHGEDST